MSRQNVEMLDKAIDAYTRGDLEAYLESAHPDVEWYPFTAEAEGGAAYHGHEGVRRWWFNGEGAGQKGRHAPRPRRWTARDPGPPTPGSRQAVGWPLASQPAVPPPSRNASASSAPPQMPAQDDLRASRGVLGRSRLVEVP